MFSSSQHHFGDVCARISEVSASVVCREFSSALPPSPLPSVIPLIFQYDRCILPGFGSDDFIECHKWKPLDFPGTLPQISDEVVKKCLIVKELVNVTIVGVPTKRFSPNYSNLFSLVFCAPHKKRTKIKWYLHSHFFGLALNGGYTVFQWRIKWRPVLRLILTSRHHFKMLFEFVILLHTLWNRL